MKNIKTKLFLSLSIFISYVDSSDYANATFDNYVSGQGVNEVLAEAQTIDPRNPYVSPNYQSQQAQMMRMGANPLAGNTMPMDDYDSSGFYEGGRIG